jgi:hypothetical protein
VCREARLPPPTPIPPPSREHVCLCVIRRRDQSRQPMFHDARGTVCSLDGYHTFQPLTPSPPLLPGRTFTKEHVAQIATVMPHAYTFTCVLCEKTVRAGATEDLEDRYRLNIDADLSQKRLDGSVSAGSVNANGYGGP